MELEIQVISMETLKPSSPTPSHLKTHTLSFLDQIFPSFHIPILLVYPTQTQHTQTQTLKSSLSYTLSKFYPLAGRLVDDCTVSCTDQGVPFVETLVVTNSRLTDFLKNGSNKLDVLHKFLPPRLVLDHDEPFLAFQVNVFACGGGVVIGCYMSHKVLDAASLGTFFKYWARQQQQNVVVGPDFHAIPSVFPSCKTIGPVFGPDRVNNINDPINDLPSFNVLVRNFVITKEKINDLKSILVRSGAVIPGPTSFETIAGFVWKNVMSVHGSTQKGRTMLSISMNMRPRTDPPLPNQSMGNCTTIVQAKGTTSSTFDELVSEIHVEILGAKAKIERFQGRNGINEIRSDVKETSKNIMDGNNASFVYHLSSWCRLGLSEVDFGFGKPGWIVPTDARAASSLRNTILFTDYSEGVEVWLFLEEEEMMVLESKPQFLAYALPNY